MSAEKKIFDTPAPTGVVVEDPQDAYSAELGSSQRGTTEGL